MNYKEMQAIATANGLGRIRWRASIALNTGKPVQSGYVVINGIEELFCKQSSKEKDKFQLCEPVRNLKNG